jgi:hypothetical protein
MAANLDGHCWCHRPDAGLALLQVSPFFSEEVDPLIVFNIAMFRNTDFCACTQQGGNNGGRNGNMRGLYFQLSPL